MRKANCEICKGSFVNEYLLKERMFGLNDSFAYGQCSSCGCLQILELPADIDKYYPPYYYSFTQGIPALRPLVFFKRIMGNLRLNKIYRKRNKALWYLRVAGTKLNHKILDVGCGKGQLICELFNLGFNRVSGVDKFLPEAIDYGFGVKVEKKELAELKEESYDLIMMHHVLEHVEEQHSTLKQIKNLLKKDGCLLIRIPVIGQVWDIYKEEWVQLDAPRHFFLHTLKSMRILAEQTGFEIRQTIFDSTDFQFWGSELYKKNIPLFSADDNYKEKKVEDFFDDKSIEQFKLRATNLNQQQLGDSAAFFLYKV